MATVVRRSRSHERQLRKRRNREGFALAQHRNALIAAAIPLEDLPEADPAEMMQLLINRVTIALRAAAAENDKLKPGLSKNQSDLEHELWRSWDSQGNLVVMSAYWVEREDKLREEMLKLTETAQRLGLSERRTRVAEGQMQLLGEALKAACVAAGIQPDQQRLLGSALRTELAVLEGTAIDTETHNAA